MVGSLGVDAQLNLSIGKRQVCSEASHFIGHRDSSFPHYISFEGDNNGIFR